MKKQNFLIYPMLLMLVFIVVASSCKKDNNDNEKKPENNSNSTTPLTAPTLSTPINGATNLWVPITFSWSTVPNATSYNIQALYYYNGQLNNVFVNSVSTSNFFTTGTNYSSSFKGKTIYWYVAAKNSTETGPWSAMWSFSLSN